jgi:hypothetical protein
MENSTYTAGQIQYVTSFKDFVSTSFHGEINAICWIRQLDGDFSEIVEKAELDGNIAELDHEALLKLQLSTQGQVAREILLHDMELLSVHGASPALNLIRFYERDDAHSIFPTDVYSFHVDRSPIATDTYLCTYYGEPSEILPNPQAEQLVLIPETRNQLQMLYGGPEEYFETFLRENFFDLHYQAKPGACQISLGVGHLWRLAVDHPESQVSPCIHRAPFEKTGRGRLLMIC